MGGLTSERRAHMRGNEKRVQMLRLVSRGAYAHAQNCRPLALDSRIFGVDGRYGFKNVKSIPRYGSGEWASDGESVKKEGVGSNTGGGQRNKEKGELDEETSVVRRNLNKGAENKAQKRRRLVEWPLVWFDQDSCQVCCKVDDWALGSTLGGTFSQIVRSRKTRNYNDRYGKKLDEGWRVLEDDAITRAQSHDEHRGQLRIDYMSKVEDFKHLDVWDILEAAYPIPKRMKGASHSTPIRITTRLACSSTIQVRAKEMNQAARPVEMAAIIAAAAAAQKAAEGRARDQGVRPPRDSISSGSIQLLCPCATGNGSGMGERIMLESQPADYRLYQYDL
ncbi:hypothetical protein DFH94DRAFT_678431 [Russula ochroleuca]|uniref:Uncharacterized protein n=1 Tax=Russula ochroleuca TaxID=152965 RepID=A0A9P5N639_9AGAM|nr:hypothetical protein DFH94DRAFT_678431 [Russula ochroleuca]